jgi:hypothetical protein
MRHLIALGAALSLAACATTSNAHLSEGKALADAWSAFDGASTSLDSMAKAGQLTASEKDVIRTDGPMIQSALQSATSAYDANADATAAQNITQASTLIAQLVAIVSAHK